MIYSSIKVRHNTVLYQNVHENYIDALKALNDAMFILCDRIDIDQKMRTDTHGGYHMVASIGDPENNLQQRDPGCGICEVPWELCWRCRGSGKQFEDYRDYQELKNCRDCTGLGKIYETPPSYEV